MAEAKWMTFHGSKNMFQTRDQVKITFIGLVAGNVSSFGAQNVSSKEF